MQVRAHQGDTVDSLCWRHLGSCAPVERVLEGNPGIAALGPILPAGTLITLPDGPVAAPPKKIIQLWD